MLLAWWIKNCDLFPVCPDLVILIYISDCLFHFIKISFKDYI